jgi:hypothetical protein
MAGEPDAGQRAPGVVARLRAGLVTLGGRRSARGVPPPRVEVVTRVGCGLCVVAERLVAEEAGDARVATRDVDADERDVRRFGVLVPVVLVDGARVAQLEVGPGEVGRALRHARVGRALGQQRSEP